MTGNALDIPGVAPKPENPESDTSGRETTSAPKAGLRFAISDTAAIMMPDNRILMMK